jgi:hypothetical protein
VAWTAPITAIAGSTVTSADFNTYVRDNLLQTMPAKAVTPGSLFITSGSNVIAERIPDFSAVNTTETTSSTTYTDLATFGPSVAITTGTKAIIIIGARIGANTAASGNPSNKMSWAVSGATTRAALDDWAAGVVSPGTGSGPSVYTSRWYLATGLTAGSNTFTAKYAVSSGTATFLGRSLQVIPL